MFYITSIRHHSTEVAGFTINRKKGYTGYTFLHFHNKVELMVDGKLIITEPHACILYAPGTMQFYKSIGPLLHDWFHFSSNTPLPLGMVCDSVYYPSDCGMVSDIVKELENEFFTDMLYHQEIITIKVKELFTKIARNANSENPPGITHKVKKTLSEVRSYVFSNLGEQWTVEKMANRAFLSASHFHNVYRTLFGRSPMDDLIAARVYSAQLALTFSNEPLTSIATRLGYNSLSHFVRQYSAIQGCSPGKYRRRYAEESWIRPENDTDNMYAVETQAPRKK